MSTLYDHISYKSSTALRKTLRSSIEDQFGCITSHIDALCKAMYANEVLPNLCKDKYKQINKALDEVGSTFALYAESRRRAIGVDSDGDIKFMGKLLNYYKQEIKELELGIEDAIYREKDPNSHEPESKKRIEFLKLFLSLNKDVENRLRDLYNHYEKLEQELYTPQDDKELTKRFNKQFYDVAKSQESDWKKEMLEIFKNISVQSTSREKQYIHSLFASPLKDVNAIYREQKKLTNSLYNYLDGGLSSLYTNPLELAREMNTRQLDNELVERIMTDLYSWQCLDDLKNAPSKSHKAKRARGRPTEENFYGEFMDLENLQKFITEEFNEQYHTPIKEDLEHGGKNSYYFLCAILVALNFSDIGNIRGLVSCFYRHLQKIFGKVGRTLRSFQKYINEFLEYLTPQKEDFSSNPKLKFKKFRVGENLLQRLVSKLSFIRLQPISI